MNEKKGDENVMNEAWNNVGKVVNQATELYLKELEAYLDWMKNFRHDLLEQTLATGQQLSRIGEEQYAYFTKLQRDVPLWGWIPKWTEPANTPTATEKRPGRAT